MADDVCVAVAESPAAPSTTPLRARGTVPDRQRSGGRRSPGLSAERSRNRSWNKALHESLDHPEIPGLGELQVGALARHDADGSPEPLDQRRVIGGVRCTGVCTAEDLGPEGLRGLDCDEVGLARRSPSTTSPSTRFKVSATRSPGTAASAPSRTAWTTASNSLGEARGRAASCTTTTLGVGGHRSKTGPDRVARVAPPDHQVGLAERVRPRIR